MPTLVRDGIAFCKASCLTKSFILSLFDDLRTPTQTIDTSDVDDVSDQIIDP